MPLNRGHLKRLVSGTIVLGLALVLGIAASAFPCGVAAGDAGPDLVVTDISLFPNNPALGDTVTVTATVKNQGTAACGASSLAGYADDDLLASVGVDPLAAGQTTTVTFTWHATAGTHDIKAIADSGETVAETDETNNTRTFTLTTLAPDLTVQAITWTPDSPSQDDSIVFNVVIKNLGNQRSQLTTVNLYIDGNSRGYQDVSGINPGATATIHYNWVALSGQHAVRATIDETGRIDESNEGNNELTVNFTTQPPDLVIPYISWSPDNPSKDDQVTFTINVKNQGNGRAGASHLAYYIDGTYQTAPAVGALDAGQSVNVTFTWKALPDSHTIKAVVDYYQNLAEADESNNENTVTFSTLTPDLVVKDITWTPQDAAVGDEVTFTAVIANRGSGRAVPSRAIVYIDGKFTGYLDYPAIDAGSQESETLKWQATAGAHVIAVVADDANALTETHEDNNKLSKNISLIPPDLLISNITWSPQNPSAGDKVTFTVTVTNQGAGDASNFYVSHYLDGKLLGNGYVSMVAHDSSVNETCTWTADLGRHVFKAVADGSSNIPESNEDNNSLSVAFAPSMPDLDVTNVTWSPANLPAGREVNFSIDIKNTGTQSAGPSRVAYYIDGQPAGYNDIGRLDAGDTVTTTFPWVAASGAHTIKVVADSGDQVFELDEDNNTKIINLPPPDLVMGDITWSPDGAAEGDTVTFSATLTNQGEGKSVDSTISYYVDGEQVASQDLPEIDVGGDYTAEFTWKAEAGVHNIRIVVDEANRVTESDETNNSRQIAFATLTPDLYIDDFGWLMENPLVDNDVTFSVVVKNRGTGNAAASQLRYTIDGGPALYKDVEALGPGKTATISFIARLQTGPHTAAATIDPDDQVNELDETNNQDTLSFSTVSPDLIVKSITWDPLDALTGDTVTITVKVENQGRDTAVAPSLTLYIDGSPLDSAEIPELDPGSQAAPAFTWKVQPGSHQISARVDTENTVSESNETNNDLSRTFKNQEPDTTATSLAGPSGVPSGKQGLLGDFWWVALLAAALLGVSAFVIALKSFKRDR